MRYNPDRHQRKSIRLKDYDYSQPGYYFITICTQNRECTLWENNTQINVGAALAPVPDHSQLSIAGKIIDKQLKSIRN